MLSGGRWENADEQPSEKQKLIDEKGSAEVKKLLLMVMAILVMTAIGCREAGDPVILVSASPDRSNPGELTDGNRVPLGQDLYLFVEVPESADMVTFWVNDPDHQFSNTSHEEISAPFDLAGTQGDGTASPYKFLAIGENTLNVLVNYPDGTEEEFMVTFTVDATIELPTPMPTVTPTAIIAEVTPTITPTPGVEATCGSNPAPCIIWSNDPEANSAVLGGWTQPLIQYALDQFIGAQLIITEDWNLLLEDWNSGIYEPGNMVVEDLRGLRNQQETQQERFQDQLDYLDEIFGPGDSSPPCDTYLSVENLVKTSGIGQTLADRIRADNGCPVP